MAFSVDEFVRVCGQCGRGYMASSGPTSRLEEKLSQAGQTHGFPTEAYATPTALFISSKNENQTITSLERIKDNEINFTDMLYFDNLLRLLSEQQGSLDLVKSQLRDFSSQKYPFGWVCFSAFLIGFFASFLRYGIVSGGLISGFISAVVFLLGRPLGGRLKFSGVFTDFVGCLLSFFLAIVLGSLWGLDPQILVLGSLVLIVPGLTLTSAISELAEHNFVSGTVKLVKAILIIVAMGVAYLVVDNLLIVLNMTKVIAPPSLPTFSFFNDELFKFIGRIFLTISFCIFFHTPLKALPGAVFCGLISLIVLDQFTNPNLFVLASFVASLTVGLASLFLGRIYKWPSQVFSTPGILLLVPGLIALSTFYDVSNGPVNGSPSYRVALTAGAIVFGLFSARMPFRVYGAIKMDDYHPERF